MRVSSVCCNHTNTIQRGVLGRIAKRYQKSTMYYKNDYFVLYGTKGPVDHFFFHGLWFKGSKQTTRFHLITISISEEAKEEALLAIIVLDFKLCY